MKLLRYYLETYIKDVGNDVPFAQKLLEIETAGKLKAKDKFKWNVQSRCSK